MLGRTQRVDLLARRTKIGRKPSADLVFGVGSRSDDEGAIRHGTDMAVEGNYVDSHGQSEIGFGITRLLGFELLPRIKRINTVKLHRPAPKSIADYPALEAALTRPIRWDQIAEQCDQMIRYATAIRTGTAPTEAILRRFMRTNAQHPTYQAMIETGRAQKIVFGARYLADRHCNVP